jgi:S-formylglutathione hydrolase FrmB
MGGYGAWYLALRRPDLFSKAASMSGALDIASLADSLLSTPENNPFQLKNSFSDALDENGKLQLAGSKYDLLRLYDDDASNGLVPKLYQAVGKSDFLYKSNRRIHELMVKRNADLVYEEGQGAHDWEFWDEYVKHILDWLLA